MNNDILHIKTITELHHTFGLSKPKHPLISVVRHSDFKADAILKNQRFSLDMYLISFKGNQQSVLKYGRNTYDFQEGTVIFISPNQVFSSSESDFSTAEDEWTIIVHSDFVHHFGLGSEISKYHFFNYESTEALHLSDDEKKSLTEIVHKIEKEYQQNIDKHTAEIIAINLETLLKYCQRFYDRQFITRKNINTGVLSKFENFLKPYFSQDLVIKGIPTVSQCGEAL